jgi:hypothetical protein
MNTTILNKLNQLENLNIFLYDNWNFMYFMDLNSEKKLKLIKSCDKNRFIEIEKFCDYILNK